MKRSRLLAVLVGLLGVGIAFFAVHQTGEVGSGFSPWSDDSATHGEGAPGQTTNSDGVSTTHGATRPIRKKAPPAEDTLNRPGPMGDDAQARRIVNRRPRADGETAGQQPDAPTGSLDKEDVRNGIHAVTPMVKVCYEETLKEFPDAAGKVTIGFRIIGEDGKGRVEMTELEPDGTTLFDEKLHDCLQARVAEAEFEVPSGGGVVNVRYPFVFDTDEEPE